MTRARLTLLLGPAFAMLLAVGCGGGTVPAGSASPAGGASKPAAGAQAGTDQWETVLAAAKREGTVTMFGPQGSTRQQALSAPFEKKYGIKVEYQGAGGPEVPPRVQKERGAGQYLWDVFLLGTSTGVLGLRPMGALDPIEPALILPEVKDPKQWRGGQLAFFDDQHIGLAVLRQSGQYFYANTK